MHQPAKLATRVRFPRASWEHKLQRKEAILHTTIFLNTCTEKQLFVLIEATLVALIEEEERAPAEWVRQQENLIINAMDKTERFGVERTKFAFDLWYRKNLKGWYQRLSKEERLAALREMPWNERTN